MSEAATAVKKNQPAPVQANAPVQENQQNRVAELRVTGHLMTLDTGLFCVLQGPGSTPPDRATGLPGVRISLPPGATGRPDAVTISTFRPDGWLDSTAALVKVNEGPAQILVTVYQLPRQGADSAPRLQVLRLSGADGASAAPASNGARAVPAPDAEVVAHIQRAGDVGVSFGEWMGKRKSGRWVEGFALNPKDGIDPKDIEYQAVLGRNWLSPWVEGGKFCGSRGMALPLLGLKVRLKGEAAKNWECQYTATFTDGSEVGPVPADEACEAETLAPLEAFHIELRRRAARGANAAKAAPGSRSARPAARPRRAA